MSEKLFDLEQEIMKCWQITNDIETITAWFVDDPFWEGIDPKVSDAICNKYFAIKELYDVKFNKLFYLYEEVAKEHFSLLKATHMGED